MKRFRSMGLAIAATAVVLAGCSGGEKAAPTGGGTPVEAGKLSGDLEVQAFQGGYGIDFYQQAGKEFAEKNPDLKVKVDGNPRVWEQLRPRFVGGTPPDLLFPGWGMDHWALAEEGQLVDLTDALKGKPYEGEGTWGDTFEPGILKLGQLDGKQYVLPYYVMLFGWWYDPAVFKKNGWTAPKTYAELLTLGEKIKAKGMAPLTYQGKYPYYMIDGMLLPWAMSVGGEEAIKAAQNLEPGAWNSPAMLRAAEMIDELNKKGFFQKGASGMTHTESQQEFLQGKAAMVPCGTWLYSEMKGSIGEGQTIEYMTVPILEGGKGDPTSLLIGIEPWMVSSASKNQGAAIELFKYMTSLPKAKQFVAEKGTLMAIKGSSDAKLPEVLKAPAAAMAASQTVWAVQYRQWYPAFNTEIENALSALLNGDVTPEGFCDRVEKAAEKTRNDPAITKHKI